MTPTPEMLLAGYAALRTRLVDLQAGRYNEVLADVYRAMSAAAWRTDAPTEEGEYLVYGKQDWSPRPAFVVDTWREQYESPVSGSSATISVGFDWDSFDAGLIAWMPLPEPPNGDRHE